MEQQRDTRNLACHSVNTVNVKVLARAVTTATDTFANPARISDPDKLRIALSGKNVLVTGVSYWIGEATAGRSAAGATVLAGRQQARQ